jgi:hypothetical protein
LHNFAGWTSFCHPLTSDQLQRTLSSRCPRSSDPYLTPQSHSMVRCLRIPRLPKPKDLPRNAVRWRTLFRRIGQISDTASWSGEASLDQCLGSSSWLDLLLHAAEGRRRNLVPKSLVRSDDRRWRRPERRKVCGGKDYNCGVVDWDRSDWSEVA